MLIEGTGKVCYNKNYNLTKETVPHGRQGTALPLQRGMAGKNAMKKNRNLRGIMWNAVFVLAVVAVAVGIWIYQFYRQGSVEATSVEEIFPPAEEELPAITITDEELSQLISGDLLLDELPMPDASSGEEEASSEAAGEEAGSDPQQDASSSTEAASSSKTTSSSASTAGTSSTGSSSLSHSSGTTASGSASASSRREEPWEAEIRALLLQVYAVKARAENGLNACIESAKAEYHALPEDKQTQTRKVTISLAKAGELSALQSSCDKEMDRIVAQMRKVLQENGQSTALADQVMDTYKKEKSTRMETLKNQLYGG